MPASRPIPGNARVYESRLISAPKEKVWELVKNLNFSWLTTVKEVKVEGKEKEVGSQRKIVYKDGTVQTIQLLEFSELENFVTYEVVTSEPALTVSSVMHSIRLYRVTFDNTVFVEWITDYSNDVSQEVLQDSKYKKLEAFEDLVKAVSKTKKTNERPASPTKAAKKQAV